MQKMGATYVLMGVRATLSIYNSLHGVSSARSFASRIGVQDGQTNCPSSFPTTALRILAGDSTFNANTSLPPPKKFKPFTMIDDDVL